MIIIIPIGGIGKRFKDNGYKNPKALINLYGKPIITYLLDNLNTNNIEYVFVPYNKEYRKFRFEDYLTKNYPKINFKFYCLENNTRGAAETINIGINHLNETKDIPVLCLDSDNFYLCDIISQWNGKNCIFSFEDFNNNPIYSYVKTNNNNEVIDIKEKEKISNYACTGAYGFSSINELKKYTKKIINENITQKSEFYTSGVIKEMINSRHNFKNIVILTNNFVCLGTPLQLKMLYNNFPKKNALTNDIIIKPKRICFDLDNTLVTYPTIFNDYTTVKPIIENINFLKYLKKFGNTIIIYTARRMKTHKGNIGKINKDIGKITFDTLEKFDIPYDEIYFGKPYADFYIDDLAINCFDNIEKEIGYYDNKITPREFHSIEENNMCTIIKKGNVNGENYYYKNIPKSLKDLFPLYIDGNDHFIIIEKIKGNIVTDMYLSELLTTDILFHILNSIIRIQETLDNNNTLNNIYYNYANKLIERYNNYDYSKFKNSKIIYQDLLNKLKNYEKNNCGKKTIIHGDPVFTNILINNYGKIKFIDMRGKIGDILTIYGDWLYDWAKIYQSLIGYDEILMRKTINMNYKKNIIEYFKQYFINKYSLNDFENLKLITKSLLFTLIPLHNNDKCDDYYNLIFSDYLQ
jgi:capsule biosynthesis phosphatase